MAKITLTLDDDLYYKYELTAKVSNIPLDKWLVTQLSQFQSITPTSRFIVLMGENRKAIEKLLGGGTLANVDQLIDALKKRLTNKLYGLEFILTEPEEREIARRAARNKRTPEKELQWMLDQIKPLIFNGLG